MQGWILWRWLQLHRYFTYYYLLLLYFITDVITDINECTEENICGGNAKCDNTEGSHNCTCLPGYFGDGLICTGNEWQFIIIKHYYCYINNVITETDFCVDNNCSTNANCRNAYGSFVCDCFSGYPGNGFNCTGIIIINYIIVLLLSIIIILY